MFFDRHNNYDDYYGPNTPGVEYSSGMSTASVILAFLSMFSSIMFYIAIPCGALSILFALLSRGRNKKVPGKCRIAILVAAAGIVSSVVTTVAAVHSVMTDPELRSQLEYTFNYYADELGLDIDFDDYFGDGKDDRDDDASESVPDDDDLANDYFNRFYGNGDGSTAPEGGAGNAAPDNDGSSAPYYGSDNALPDPDDIFPGEDSPYWFGFGGPGPGSGSQTTPSGGEYI